MVTGRRREYWPRCVPQRHHPSLTLEAGNCESIVPFRAGALLVDLALDRRLLGSAKRPTRDTRTKEQMKR